MLEDEHQKPKRVACYLRVSTDEQAYSGQGINMQKDAFAAILELKKKLGLWVHQPDWVFIDEGYSGGTLLRPAFERMMVMAKEKAFDLVVVWKIDRLSRTLTHLLKVFEELQDYEVSFMSLKESIDFTGPVGKLTFQIFGALAEFERELIRARTAEGKLSSARRGNYIGNGVPYGYMRSKTGVEGGKRLEIINEEALIVKKIFGWFIFDRMNYEEIARKLNMMGVPKGIASRNADKGTHWIGVTIADMLRNMAYSGIRIERIKDSDRLLNEVRVSVPRIIDVVTFEQARRLAIEVTDSRGKKGGGGKEYLLSRKIIDPQTQRKFVGYTRTKSGHNYRRKKFTDPVTSQVHRNIEIPGKAVDDLVIQQIKLAANDPKKFYQLYKSQSKTEHSIEKISRDLDELDLQLASLEQKLLNIMDTYCSGKMSDETKDKLEFKENDRKHRLEQEKRKLEAQLKIHVQMSLAQIAIKDFSEGFHEKIDGMTPERLKILIDLLVEKVVFIHSDRDEAEDEVQVTFRFDQPNAFKEGRGLEPKKGSGKPQNCLLGMSSSDNGRGSRSRTCGLLVPNQAR